MKVLIVQPERLSCDASSSCDVLVQTTPVPILGKASEEMEQLGS